MKNAEIVVTVYFLGVFCAIIGGRRHVVFSEYNEQYILNAVGEENA